VVPSLPLVRAVDVVVVADAQRLVAIAVAKCVSGFRPLFHFISRDTTRAPSSSSRDRGCRRALGSSAC
jgi:hypothetical protein